MWCLRGAVLQRAEGSDLVGYELLGGRIQSRIQGDRKWIGTTEV